MQTLFHKNSNCQWIANGQSCMVRIHTKPESQMMTPDTRHTQASVQITTKTPFQLLVSQQLFCSTSTIQWYNLQNDFSICICTPTRFKWGARLHQQSQPPCQSTTSAFCSYSPLVSCMLLLCVPIDHSFRIWSCYTGDSPLLCVRSFNRGCNWTWTLSLLEPLCHHCCHLCPNLPFRIF
jgi:hypothetical protein